ncbi:uncharacterized protein LMH87_007676 [Akanthomyces muscarius]|uniref:Uncharacterized protein n=1 Tax=Akanthomyces muscarius TaxID=2231603 RepID=A0A9W8URD0_AKAMU|nr:uncharacterized protein LMH87_007676 [Akanthomyces muscarius]KAJ4161649.1 hypothetical protein LMH87_007676 [Akanthomyces muscarius]
MSSPIVHGSPREDAAFRAEALEFVLAHNVPEAYQRSPAKFLCYVFDALMPPAATSPHTAHQIDQCRLSLRCCNALMDWACSSATAHPWNPSFGAFTPENLGEMLQDEVQVLLTKRVADRRTLEFKADFLSALPAKYHDFASLMMADSTSYGQQMRNESSSTYCSSVAAPQHGECDAAALTAPKLAEETVAGSAYTAPETADKVQIPTGGHVAFLPSASAAVPGADTSGKPATLNKSTSGGDSVGEIGKPGLVNSDAQDDLKRESLRPVTSVAGDQTARAVLDSCNAETLRSMRNAFSELVNAGENSPAVTLATLKAILDDVPRGGAIVCDDSNDFERPSVSPGIRTQKRRVASDTRGDALPTRPYKSARRGKAPSGGSRSSFMTSLPNGNDVDYVIIPSDSEASM